MAFEQYLEHGCDGVSISVLQEATKLGRATIYYHFASKEGLFREVVNKYVAGGFRSFVEKTDRPDLSIGQLIQSLADQLGEIAAIVKGAGPERRLTCYLSLVVYAYSHDEEFRDFANELEKRLRSSWVKAIRNSRKEGEICEVNPESTADLFCGLDKFSGWEVEAGLFVPEESPFVRNCRLLFQLIKEKQKNRPGGSSEEPHSPAYIV